MNEPETSNTTQELFDAFLAGYSLSGEGANYELDMRKDPDVHKRQMWISFREYQDQKNRAKADAETVDEFIMRKLNLDSSADAGVYLAVLDALGIDPETPMKKILNIITAK